MNTKNKYKPWRVSADLNKYEGDEIVVIKLGFFWHSIRGFFEMLSYSRLIHKSNKEAKSWGLLKSDEFLYSYKHSGILQYWSSYKSLEDWSRKNKEHLDWWKEMEAKNKWKHMSVYHEVYVVPKEAVETVYNLPHNMNIEERPGLLGVLPATENPEYRARNRFLKCPHSATKEENI
ncbi:MAG TPA: phenylacetaldoxime dehydratase family protein [Vampirovibrionales bacterium]